MKKLILCAICAICGLTAQAQAKFGHVNTQEIIQAMPEYTKAKGELDALQAQYEADLKSMQDELQKKGDRLRKVLLQDGRMKYDFFLCRICVQVSAEGVQPAVDPRSRHRLCPTENGMFGKMGYPAMEPLFVPRPAADAEGAVSRFVSGLPKRIGKPAWSCPKNHYLPFERDLRSEVRKPGTSPSFNLCFL